MGFRYYRSCGTCGTEIGSDSAELADAELAKHPCISQNQTFMEQVAQAVHQMCGYETVIVTPIGDAEPAILVTADDAVYTVTIDKLADR